MNVGSMNSLDWAH